MNWDAFKRELVQHYAELRKEPATAEHAWKMVNEFARQFPNEFKDLPTLVTVEVNRERK